MSTRLHFPLDALALPGTPLVPDVSAARQIAWLRGSAAIAPQGLVTGSTGYLELPAGRVPPLGERYTIQYYVSAATPNLGNVGQGRYAWSGWTGLTCSIRGRIGSMARIYFSATSSADEQYLDVTLPPVRLRNHVAVQRDGTQGAVFINGTLAGSIDGLRPPPAAASAEPFLVGKWNYDRAEEIVPLTIADLRIDDSALYSANFTPPGPFPHTPWRVGFHAAGRVLRHTPYAAGPPRFMPAPAPLRLIENLYFGGRATLAGTVTLKGSPDALPLMRRVRLLRDRDAIMLGETWSDAGGHYAFHCLDARETYTAIAYDHTGRFESVCASGLAATEPP